MTEITPTQVSSAFREVISQECDVDDESFPVRVRFAIGADEADDLRDLNRAVRQVVTDLGVRSSISELEFEFVEYTIYAE